MILLDGGIGRLVPSAGPLGVIPANFAALGTSPSPLANDADLPADASTQWLWVLTAPLVASGTTDANDAGGYSLVGAADGVWSQGYRGLTMAADGTVVVYTANIQTTVAAAVTTSAVDAGRGRRRRSVPSRIPTTSTMGKKSSELDRVPLKTEAIFGMTAEEEADDEAAAIAAAHLLLS